MGEALTLRSQRIAQPAPKRPEVAELESKPFLCFPDGGAGVVKL